MVRNAELSQCNRTVKELCKKASVGVSHHGKCKDKVNNAVLFSGGDINTFLQSLGSGYGRDSRVGISTEANVLNDDEDYLVCANF